MSATVTGDLKVVTDYASQSYAGTGGSDTDSFVQTATIGFTSANNGNTWSYVADGANHNALLTGTLTLTLSALSGPRGGTVALTKVRKFFLWNQSTTDSVKVGSAGTHPWTPFGLASQQTIPPGGILCFGSNFDPGWVVTSGSADQLLIDATGAANPVPFTLEMMGP
jgi:hypothetical protein